MVEIGGSFHGAWGWVSTIYLLTSFTKENWQKSNMEFNADGEVSSSLLIS